MTRPIYVCKASGRRWVVTCICGWWGFEPSLPFAGDLGRLHVAHHRAEIRPATTTTHEEQE